MYDKIGKFTSYLALMVYTVILSGFTVSTLWGWFLVPVLSLPIISVAEAAGISLIVRYMSYRPPTSDKSLADSFWDATMTPIVALLLGFLFTYWI